MLTAPVEARNFKDYNLMIDAVATVISIGIWHCSGALIYSTALVHCRCGAAESC